MHTHACEFVCTEYPKMKLDDSIYLVIFIIVHIASSFIVCVLISGNYIAIACHKSVKLKSRDTKLSIRNEVLPRSRRISLGTVLGAAPSPSLSILI